MFITSHCSSVSASVPRVQFREVELRVDEADGRAVAVVTRDGDLGLTSVVRCYTRQGSAQVMMDYEERPDTDDSVVTFRPGKRDSTNTWTSGQIGRCPHFAVFHLMSPFVT